MKNILLLTDFSDNAQNAINYAMEFFKGGTYNFFLLNVQKVSNYTTGDLMTSTATTSVYDTIIKDPKVALNNMIKKLENDYKDENYSFETICDYDSFISAINQTIKLKSIDLIVMGSNGTTGAKEVIFGSNTINVIRNVDCPVLVIPQDYKYNGLNSIVFATNADEKFNRKPLKPLLHIVFKFNSELNILTLEKDEIINSFKEEKVKMDEFFKGINLSFYAIENVPADIAIDSFVQIKQVDLTATIINKESFFKRLISGSATDEITYNSRVPLLIMHP
jgi:nucleotide-binding universal stress UspA family protein